MKRFSFNTFLPAEGNRAALDICNRIADLERVSPMPVLLLGEEGCGKTHLLYSIWKRVKATSPRTSLAVVTAREFRREIRDLIGDPAPVEKAESAILLIDQLELFEELLEELEAVVRIFLDNKHAVMLASNVHPRRLKALPQGLRDMLTGGQTVEIRLQEGETQIEVLRRELRRESQGVIEKQRGEIDRLRELLERVGAADEGGEAAALRQALEQERGERDELSRQLEVATQFGHSLQEEIDSLNRRLEHASNGAQVEEKARLEEAVSSARRELEDTRAELASLQQELARRGDTEEEVEHLREALEASQSEKNRVLAETEAARETERRELEEQLAGLRQEAESARQESAQARHEANMLVERAEKLVAQIESNQTRFRETEQDQRRQIEELEALLAMRTPSEEQSERAALLEQQLQETQVRLEGVQREYERERRNLAERLAQNEEHIQNELSRVQEETKAAQQALDEVSAERDEAREALNDTARERDALQAALEDLQREFDARDNALQEVRAEQQAVEAALGDSREETERLREIAENAGRERQEAQTALDETRTLLEDVRTELEQSRQRADAQENELDALRREAAEQVAAANAQAGELEGQLAALQARLARTGDMRTAAATELAELRTRLVSSAEGLDALCARLSATDEQLEIADAADEDAAWDTPAPLPREAMREAAAPLDEPRPERPVPAPDDEDQFDDDRMVLPPAPDEEDIEPAGLESNESEANGEGWTGLEAPNSFELPETPMGPLEDLSPLEDERE